MISPTFFFDRVWRMLLSSISGGGHFSLDSGDILSK